jgi:hypothetical protein
VATRVRGQGTWLKSASMWIGISQLEKLLSAKSPMRPKITESPMVSAAQYCRGLSRLQPNSTLCQSLDGAIPLVNINNGLSPLIRPNVCPETYYLDAATVLAERETSPSVKTEPQTAADYVSSCAVSADGFHPLSVVAIRGHRRHDMTG